ncbi:MAG: hypothetical protein E7005_08050 [Alphaproteobacteria bacterium]|nr:hypothetical protein [Alphaproteobacteria bacterium]
MSDDILEKQLFEIIRNKDLSEDIKLAKIDMLNKLGVKVNAMYGAWTPLHIAKKQKEPKVIEFLTKIGAIDVVDDKKRKSLCYKLRNVICIKGGDINEVKELIDMGADVNLNISSGKNVLSEASRMGYIEVVELLIENGADVNQKNDIDGSSPLGLACINNYEDIAKLLISKKADVNHKDREGSPLIYASHHGNKELVELLIKHGAKVNDKNKNGHSVLMSGVSSGNKEVVELLIKHGAKVDAKDDDGNTALINLLYTIKKKEEIAECLVFHGADMNAKNARGQTAYEIAEPSFKKAMLQGQNRRKEQKQSAFARIKNFFER